jgi:hypothetical protein
LELYVFGTFSKTHVGENRRYDIGYVLDAPYKNPGGENKR